ncbi:hypothetical protein CCY99_08525 [Helicobacter sp. 16-1353]|uniref:TonB-dependent receptor n=1 Tax=Helicobacter sp. 16-1353 TaxID=2004996 RepID=UPI000DCF113B|nr:TonB-dependent receptor [Helicobacter sp. 16-1353]RAX51708.1 hypothetical protein CCY99_08525 [Helicobacter sp. 16-1353]
MKYKNLALILVFISALQGLESQDSIESNKSIESAESQESMESMESKNSQDSTDSTNSQDSKSASSGLKQAQIEISITDSFMKSQVDDLNRNVYIIDKDFIADKGFRNTTEIFDYVPFVSKNNVGLGSNLDIRGQGQKSNIATQILLNDTNLNMLDSSHGTTPLDSIAVGDIERIEILPGGGAVMYGNGTRGGVVNIITKKKYETFTPSAGVSYTGTPTDKSGLFGSKLNANARVAGKMLDSLYYSLSGAYGYEKGYREGDERNAFNLGGNLTYDINANNSLFIDVSGFHGITDTSPNLLFSIGTTFGSATGFGSDNNAPSKSKRYDKGQGDIKMKQNRADVAIGYEGQFGDNHSFQAKLVHHYLQNRYLHYVAGAWYANRASYMYVPNFSQSGSYFEDMKYGLQLRYDWQHGSGTLIVGFDSIYNIGERFLNLHYDGLMNTVSATMAMDHDIQTPVDANKWTNSLYLIEKYNFTPRLSLTAGARYENANYTGERRYYSNRNTIITSTSKKIKDNISNFALEIAPKYSFESGDLYAKYERGYLSPNPDMLTFGLGNGVYTDSNLKSEKYNTLEFGAKGTIGNHVFLSGAIFYTLTQDEIYSFGSAHSGLSGFGYSNYDLTSRAGIELYSEQYAFNESLRFSESFTYIDARILKGKQLTNLSGSSIDMKNKLIPYVSSLKATIGIEWDINDIVTLWTQNSINGPMRDAAYKRLKAYVLSDLGIDLNLGSFKTTIGVRNVADTAYFVYYNSSSIDPTIGNAYLYAQGRNYFIDFRYSY